jgi:hypothetical protein
MASATVQHHAAGDLQKHVLTAPRHRAVRQRGQMPADRLVGEDIVVRAIAASDERITPRALGHEVAVIHPLGLDELELARPVGVDEGQHDAAIASVVLHGVYRQERTIRGTASQNAVAFFSHLKRLASDYCWSRGRRNKIDNAEQPRGAWINELLCKFIYFNLRATVTREEMTGYRADYLVGDKFFPAPSERLIDA